MDRQWWQAYDQACWLCCRNSGPLSCHACSWQAGWPAIVSIRWCRFWQCTRYEINLWVPACTWRSTIFRINSMAWQAAACSFEINHRSWIRFIVYIFIYWKQRRCLRFASSSSHLRLCWIATGTIRLFSPSLPEGSHPSWGIWARFIKSTLLQPVRLSTSLTSMQNTLRRLSSEPMYSQSPCKCVCVGFCAQASSQSAAQDLKLFLLSEFCIPYTFQEFRFLFYDRRHQKPDVVLRSNVHHV